MVAMMADGTVNRVAQLPWRPGVVTAVRGLRHLREEFPHDQLLGAGLATLCQQVPPGDSMLVQALLDDSVWPARTGVADNVNSNLARVGYLLTDLPANLIRLARADRAQDVGERHLAERIAEFGADQLQGLDPGQLIAAVREMEIGPEIAGEEGRFQALVDSAVILQYHNIDEIDWSSETAQAQVTVWIPVTVLNELEQLRYASGSRRVRNRATLFAGWLENKLDDALVDGYTMKNGARLRVWAPPSEVGRYDPDHLRAALALLEGGIQPTVVTSDMGLTARARITGISTLQLSKKHALKPEPTPAEEDLRFRRLVEGIESPPLLRLEITRRLPDTGRWVLHVECEPDGGEAREVSVAFNVDFLCEGTQLLDRLGSGGEIPRSGDGLYRQSLPRLLSPDSREMIAEFTGPPLSLTYEIRAAKSRPRRGTIQHDPEMGAYVDQPQPSKNEE